MCRPPWPSLTEELCLFETNSFAVSTEGVANMTLAKNKGTFTCEGCNYCRFLNLSKNITLPNGEQFKPRHYAYCQTCGVVYLLVCECTSFYVGKTIQEFWRRAYRHITSMKTCNSNLPLGRHVTKVHEGICPKCSFLLIDCVLNY